MPSAAAVMESRGQKASCREKGSARAHRVNLVSRVRHETRVLRHADRKCHVIFWQTVMPSLNWMKMARRFCHRLAILKVMEISPASRAHHAKGDVRGNAMASATNAAHVVAVVRAHLLAMTQPEAKVAHSRPSWVKMLPVQAIMQAIVQSTILAIQLSRRKRPTVQVRAHLMLAVADHGAICVAVLRAAPAQSKQLPKLSRKKITATNS